MERTQAFAEYARILQDLEDSCTGGFKRPEKQLDVNPPATGRAASRPPDSQVMTPSQEQRNHPSAASRSADSATGTASPNLMHASGPAESEAAPIRQTEEAVPAPQAPAARTTDTAPPEQLSARPASSPESVQELKNIAGDVAACRACNLYLLRENTVPGIGYPGATLMVVTSPPNDSSTEQSTPLPPFEQEYLEKWLRALGLDPAMDVFITPSVKCRTPGGRPPQPEEAAACVSFLRRQYKTVAPRAVLALGSSGCGALTGNPGDFPSLVGKDWMWGAVPALVLWTPAEVLANPGRLRGPVWDALQRLKVAWNDVSGSKL